MQQGCGAGRRSSRNSTAPPGHPAQSVLLDPCAAPLNQNDQDDDKKHAADNPDNHGTVHIDSSFLQLPNDDLNDSMIMMTAGPITTTKSAGKMKRTSGKISLMVLFAAISSTCCTRWVLRVSE